MKFLCYLILSLSLLCSSGCVGTIALIVVIHKSRQKQAVPEVKEALVTPVSNSQTASLKDQFDSCSSK